MRWFCFSKHLLTLVSLLFVSCARNKSQGGVGGEREDVSTPKLIVMLSRQEGECLSV